MPHARGLPTIDASKLTSSDGFLLPVFRIFLCYRPTLGLFTSRVLASSGGGVRSRDIEPSCVPRADIFGRGCQHLATLDTTLLRLRVSSPLDPAGPAHAGGLPTIDASKLTASDGFLLLPGLSALPHAF